MQNSQQQQQQQQQKSEAQKQLSKLVDMLLKLDDRFDQTVCYELARYISAQKTFEKLPLAARGMVHYYLAGGLRDAAVDDMGVRHATASVECITELQNRNTKGKESQRDKISELLRMFSVRKGFCQAKLQELGPGGEEAAIPQYYNVDYFEEICESCFEAMGPVQLEERLLKNLNKE